MKTKFWNSMGRRIAASLAVTATLLLGTSKSAAQPFTTPGGLVWDCELSGSRSGLAQLLFTAPDGTTPGTLFALELIVPKKPAASTDTRGGDDSRTGGLTNSVGGDTTNLFGAALFTGQWNFDNKGRIIGNLFESTAPVSCVTNTVVVSTSVTNGSTVTTTSQTNTTVDCSGGLTNGYSFTGSVNMRPKVPRLTLQLKGTGGSTTYRGVPAVQLPDASGGYYGDRIQTGNHHSTEFLTLTPTVVDPFDMNLYTVTGNGPSYGYTDGLAVLSAWKKIGFVMIIDPSNQVLRATIGSVNTNKFTAKTAGLEEANDAPLPRIWFNVTRFQ